MNRKQRNTRNKRFDDVYECENGSLIKVTVYCVRKRRSRVNDARLKARLKSMVKYLPIESLRRLFMLVD